MFLFTYVLYILATFLAVLMLRRVLWKTSVSRRYPPSLPSLPIVGSLPFIWKFNNLHEYFRMKADQLGPIFTFRMGSRLCLTLNSRETIEEALVKNSSCFAGREHFYMETVTNKSGKGIIAMQFSVDFKRYHKIALSVLRDFGFGNRLMETRILKEFQEMASAIREKDGKEFDPTDFAALCTYNVIKVIVLGKREDLANGLDEVIQSSRTLIQSVNPVMDVAPTLLELLPHFRRQLNICVETVFRMNNILNKDIENVKKDCKVECFVSRYLAQIGPDYDQEQLVFTIRDLITAGSETTATTLLWLLIFVANNPALQKRLQKEIDDVISRHRLPSLDDQPMLSLVEATILETQRLRTIVPLSVPHLTLSDSEVCGFFIPARTKVFVNLHAVHMDKKTWKDPDEFRPERFLDENNKITGRDGIIPFSIGRRSCLGEILARQELFLFLAGLIQQFDIQLGEDGQRIDEKPVVEVTMRPQPFKIRLIPRKN